MCRRNASFACDVIFMIFWYSRFQTLSRGLVSLHDACMLCLWNFVEFTTLRFSFLKIGEFLCPSFAKRCRLHWNFQLSPCVLMVSLKSLSTFERCRVWASRLPILALPSSELLLTCRTTFPATNGQVWLMLEFFVSRSSDHIYPLGGFSTNIVNFPDPHRRSNNHQHGVLATRPSLCA